MLVEIDFGINHIIFDLIVDEVVHDVGPLKVHPETAGLTSACGLDSDVAAFVERAGGCIGEVLLAGIGDDGYIFISSQNVILNLLIDSKGKFFIFFTTEIDVIEDMDIAGHTIEDLELDKDSLVLEFVDYEVEGNYLKTGMPSFGDRKGDIEEFMTLEGNWVHVHCWNCSGVGGVLVFALDDYAER